ncbi:MAG: hypothetical protein HY928_06920, partial [Elusimicrobia bacterium]|nr:hypothetical protein [Elusimicrobiota bacterium]
HGLDDGRSALKGAGLTAGAMLAPDAAREQAARLPPTGRPEAAQAPPAGQVLPERAPLPTGFKSFAPAPTAPPGTAVTPAPAKSDWLAAAWEGAYAFGKSVLSRLSAPAQTPPPPAPAAPPEVPAGLPPGAPPGPPPPELLPYLQSGMAHNIEGYTARLAGNFPLAPREYAEYFALSGNYEAAGLVHRSLQAQAGRGPWTAEDQARLEAWKDFPLREERAVAELQVRKSLAELHRRLGGAVPPELGRSPSDEALLAAAWTGKTRARANSAAVAAESERAREKNYEDMQRRGRNSAALRERYLFRHGAYFSNEELGLLADSNWVSKETAELLRRRLAERSGGPALSPEERARYRALEAFSFDEKRAALWAAMRAGTLDPARADELRSAVLERLAPKLAELTGEGNAELAERMGAGEFRERLDALRAMLGEFDAGTGRGQAAAFERAVSAEQLRGKLGRLDSALGSPERFREAAAGLAGHELAAALRHLERKGLKPDAAAVRELRRLAAAYASSSPQEKVLHDLARANPRGAEARRLVAQLSTLEALRHAAPEMEAVAAKKGLTPEQQEAERQAVFDRAKAGLTPLVDRLLREGAARELADRLLAEGKDPASDERLAELLRSGLAPGDPAAAARITATARREREFDAGAGGFARGLEEGGEKLPSPTVRLDSPEHGERTERWAREQRAHAVLARQLAKEEVDLQRRIQQADADREFVKITLADLAKMKEQMKKLPKDFTAVVEDAVANGEASLDDIARRRESLSASLAAFPEEAGRKLAESRARLEALRGELDAAALEETRLESAKRDAEFGALARRYLDRLGKPDTPANRAEAARALKQYAAASERARELTLALKPEGTGKGTDWAAPGNAAARDRALADLARYMPAGDAQALFGRLDGDALAEQAAADQRLARLRKDLGEYGAYKDGVVVLDFSKLSQAKDLRALKAALQGFKDFGRYAGAGTDPWEQLKKDLLEQHMRQAFAKRFELVDPKTGRGMVVSVGSGFLKGLDGPEDAAQFGFADLRESRRQAAAAADAAKAGFEEVGRERKKLMEFVRSRFVLPWGRSQGVPFWPEVQAYDKVLREAGRRVGELESFGNIGLAETLTTKDGRTVRVSAELLAMQMGYQYGFLRNIDRNIVGTEIKTDIAGKDEFIREFLITEAATAGLGGLAKSPKYAAMAKRLHTLAEGARLGYRVTALSKGFNDLFFDAQPGYALLDEGRRNAALFAVAQPVNAGFGRLGAGLKGPEWLKQVGLSAAGLASAGALTDVAFGLAHGDSLGAIAADAARNAPTSALAGAGAGLGQLGTAALARTSAHLANRPWLTWGTAFTSGLAFNSSLNGSLGVLQWAMDEQTRQDPEMKTAGQAFLRNAAKMLPMDMGAAYTGARNTTRAILLERAAGMPFAEAQKLYGSWLTESLAGAEPHETAALLRRIAEASGKGDAAEAGRLRGFLDQIAAAKGVSTEKYLGSVLPAENSVKGSVLQKLGDLWADYGHSHGLFYKLSGGTFGMVPESFGKGAVILEKLPGDPYLNIGVKRGSPLEIARGLKDLVAWADAKGVPLQGITNNAALVKFAEKHAAEGWKVQPLKEASWGVKVKRLLQTPSSVIGDLFGVRGNASGQYFVLTREVPAQGREPAKPPAPAGPQADAPAPGARIPDQALREARQKAERTFLGPYADPAAQGGARVPAGEGYVYKDPKTGKAVRIDVKTKDGMPAEDLHALLSALDLIAGGNPGDVLSVEVVTEPGSKTRGTYSENQVRIQLNNIDFPLQMGMTTLHELGHHVESRLRKALSGEELDRVNALWGARMEAPLRGYLESRGVKLGPEQLAALTEYSRLNGRLRRAGEAAAMPEALEKSVAAIREGLPERQRIHLEHGLYLVHAGELSAELLRLRALAERQGVRPATQEEFERFVSLNTISPERVLAAKAQFALFQEYDRLSRDPALQRQLREGDRALQQALRKKIADYEAYSDAFAELLPKVKDKLFHADGTAEFREGLLEGLFGDKSNGLPPLDAEQRANLRWTLRDRMEAFYQRSLREAGQDSSDAVSKDLYRALGLERKNPKPDYNAAILRFEAEMARYRLTPAEAETARNFLSSIKKHVAATGDPDITLPPDWRSPQRNILEKPAISIG